jgi:hypothetical protein
MAPVDKKSPIPPQEGAPQKRIEGNSTSMFQIESGPGVEEVRLPATSNKMMAKVKEMLDPSRWEPQEPNESGVIFANFANNIRGCAAVTLQSRRTPDQKDTFFVVTTRRNVWLVYSTPHETLHDHYETLMNVNLKRRTILAEKLQEGQPGQVAENAREGQPGKALKRRYISHLTSSDLRNFYATASFYKAQEPPKAKPVAIADSGTSAPFKDTISPDLDMNVDIQDMQRKLRTSALIISSRKGFSLQEFSETVKFVATFSDEFGRMHYFIIAGENETVYRLYVNANAAPSPGVVGFTRFRYCNDACIMYEEGS